MRTRFIVLAVWTLTVILLLVIPLGRDLPGSGIRYFDKIAHFGMFFVTGFLSVYAFGFLSKLLPRLIFSMIFGAVLSLGTELGQSFISYRTASPFDLLADIVGLVFGLFAFALLYMWKENI